jgi:excisionase family DNA binding protein
MPTDFTRHELLIDDAGRAGSVQSSDETDVSVGSPGRTHGVSFRRPDAVWTVREVARRYRVSQDKIRTWIRTGELRAVNTAAVLCGKPRWVVSEEALAEFERRRSSVPSAKPQPVRRQRLQRDNYPDA